MEALELCRHRLFISTADVKDLYFPPDGVSADHRKGQGQCRQHFEVMHAVRGRGVEVRLLHSGVPSGPFLASSNPANRPR